MCLRNAISPLDFMSIKADEMSNHLSLKMGFIYKTGSPPFIWFQNNTTEFLRYSWKMIILEMALVLATLDVSGFWPVEIAEVTA